MPSRIGRNRPVNLAPTGARRAQLIERCEEEVEGGGGGDLDCELVLAHSQLWLWRLHCPSNQQPVAMAQVALQS